MKIGDCVGQGIFVFVLFFLGSIGAQAQLWVEDFVAEANGATTGTASGTLGGTWSVTTDPSGTFSVQDDNFEINNTVTEGTWSSNVFDISAAGYAIIDVDYGSAGLGFSNADYIKFYYRIDGGPEILFAEAQGDVWDVAAAEASAIVAGNTLQVIIKAVDNSNFFILGGVMWIDQLTITAAPIIYSRKSGTWTDVTGGVNGTGTWSLTGHTGNACGCYPLNTQVAVIGNGHTVTLPSSQTAIGTPPTTNLAPGAVDVKSASTLQFNTSGVTLGIQKGLFRVRSGGTVNSSAAGITGEQISFNAAIGGATLQVDTGGTLSIEDLVLGTGAADFHYFSGGGSLAISDDILIEASDATLTNNRSASFTVSGDIDFNGANSSFVNNAALIISGDILMDANNSLFTNNASSLTVTDDLNFNSINSAFTNNATASIADIVSTDTGDDDNVVTNSSGATLTLGGIDANGADLDVLNAGTIDQSGNFSNISNSDTNFDNLATGIWNWTLTLNTTYDTDIATVLDLTAVGNTFDYKGNGAQRIIPTTYHHIKLSTSGAKDANNASFSVQGNWTVSGTATFTEGTGTITLDGPVAQTITNPAGETFYNLVIDNSYGISPQITLADNVIVSRVLTMTDGNVNLGGKTFTLTRTANDALGHSLASSAGWMYNGSFARARAASSAFGNGVPAVVTAQALFPLGSANDWRPFFVGQSSNPNTAGTITVSHINSTSTSNVSIGDPAPGTMITKRHNAYWSVTTTGIAAGATYTLQAGGTNFGTISSNTHIRMATSTGVVGSHVAGSGGPTDWRVNRSVVFAGLVNNFHVSSTNATNSPLPIELLSFSAQLKNKTVELKWSTASETNNHNFTIERATDIEHFEPIFTLDGQGTTKELNRYVVFDSTPLYGRSYYRLKQTDFDGKFTYSELRTIDYEGPIFATLTAFPNPSNGSDLNIRLEGLKTADDVRVEILNIRGQKVFEKIIEIRTPGVTVENISNLSLPPGLYVVKAGDTKFLIQKIVVEE